METPSDLNEMDGRIGVKTAVEEGKISEAILMVHHLHPELLDDDRYLFFHLQVKTRSLE